MAAGGRKRASFLGTLASAAEQGAAAISGLVVPVLIIRTFGSEVNGAVSAAVQFLSYISLLELGVGAVALSAMYGPLARQDRAALAGVYREAEHIFHRVGLAFLVYLAIVAALFPRLTGGRFEPLWSATLVLIIGIATCGQYFFGLAPALLLQADQRLHIVKGVSAAAILLNVLLTYILIKMGFGIHAVRLGSAAAFLLRPAAAWYCVRRRYGILGEKNDRVRIPQQRDGLAMQVADTVHQSTDTVIVSIFLGPAMVSVFTVYRNIAVGLSGFAVAVIMGCRAQLGNLMAGGEQAVLRRSFALVERLSVMAVTVLFTVMGCMVLPFVAVYTAGVTDAEYLQPVFAVVFTIAEAAFSVRVLYETLINAAGHFRQSKSWAYAEAGGNVLLSLLLVRPFGLTGVALATLLATGLRIGLSLYHLRTNILHRPARQAVACLGVNAGAAAISVLFARAVPTMGAGYPGWILRAVCVMLITSAVTVLLNCLAAPELPRTAAQLLRARRNRE